MLGLVGLAQQLVLVLGEEVELAADEVAEAVAAEITEARGRGRGARRPRRPRSAPPGRAARRRGRPRARRGSSSSSRIAPARPSTSSGETTRPAPKARTGSARPPTSYTTAGTPAPSARSSAPLWSSSARYGKTATVASPSARSISVSRQELRRRRRRRAGALRRTRDDRLACLVELLVRADEPEREHGAPSSRRSLEPGKTGCGMTRSLSSATPNRGERLAAALAVHDDAVEAAEEAAPERFLLRRAPRQQVVRGEDERRAWRSSRASSSGAASHCTCTTSAGTRASRARPERVLERLQRQPQPRAAEERATRAGRRARAAGSRPAAGRRRSGSAR